MFPPVLACKKEPKEQVKTPHSQERERGSTRLSFVVEPRHHQPGKGNAAVSVNSPVSACGRQGGMVVFATFIAATEAVMRPEGGMDASAATAWRPGYHWTERVRGGGRGADRHSVT